MKSVLISIRPEWCKKIASGEKTIEVRKTRPKMETPFKCYIYCTLGKKERFICRGDDDMPFDVGNGTVIGEFVCDGIDKFTSEFVDDVCYENICLCYEDMDGGEESIIITSNEEKNPDDCWLCKEARLSFSDFKNYIGTNFHEIPFYGWHISELKIYDTPKELREFKPWNRTEDMCHYSHLGLAIPKCEDCHECKITRPPQSWCYVEELKR